MMKGTGRSSSSAGGGRPRSSTTSTAKESKVVHEKERSPKRLSKVNKYEGIEVSPSASLFNFNFGKNKKGSGLNSSMTASEEEGENGRVRTRRYGSSDESRGDSVRKTSEKGRERKSSLEKEADPVPPKKSKVVVKARPPGKVADKIVEENEEEVDEKADDSDLNDIFDKTGKDGKKKEDWLRNLDLRRKRVEATPVESVIRNSRRPSTSSSAKGLRLGPRIAELRGKEKLTPKSKDSPRSSTVEHVLEQQNRGHVARNLEDLMDAGESDFNNTADGVRGSSINGNLQVPCLLDSNPEEYKKLRNASQMDYLSVQLSAPCASYTLPSALEWTVISPGVHMAVCFNSHNFKAGYLRIAPGTVKPMERVSGGVICFALIDGKIVSKSSSFAFKDNGTPYLTSVELVEGSYITVPRDAAYSLENWSEEESSLHFVIYSDNID